jgi:hypothetical protein
MRRAYGLFEYFVIVELTLMLSTSDLTLPPYYVMNYCILIASAMDNWNEADLWRLSAEQSWYTARAKAASMRDHGSLEVLDEVRLRLDMLEEQQLEDITGLSKEQREAALDEDMATDDSAVEDEFVRLAEQELEDIVGSDHKDQDEVAAVENADEVATNQLPFRPSNGHASETSQVPAIDVTASAEGSQPSTASMKSIRRNQKSRNKGKGGAANAHTFTRSLGRSSPHPRVLKMEWDQRK